MREDLISGIDKKRGQPETILFLWLNLSQTLRKQQVGVASDESVIGNRGTIKGKQRAAAGVSRVFRGQIGTRSWLDTHKRIIARDVIKRGWTETADKCNVRIGRVRRRSSREIIRVNHVNDQLAVGTASPAADQIGGGSKIVLIVRRTRPCLPSRTVAVQRQLIDILMDDSAVAKDIARRINSCEWPEKVEFLTADFGGKRRDSRENRDKQ